MSEIQKFALALLNEFSTAEASAPAVEQQHIGVIKMTASYSSYVHWNPVMPPAGTKLYAAPHAADTDKVREAILGLTLDIEPTIFASWTRAEQDAYCKGFHHAQQAASELLPVMAAQAPVREVPDMQKFMESAKAFAMAHINSDDLDARVAADMVSGKYTVTDEEHEAMDNAYNTTKAALVAAYRALPAAPVQQEGGE